MQLSTPSMFRLGCRGTSVFEFTGTARWLCRAAEYPIGRSQHDHRSRNGFLSILLYEMYVGQPQGQQALLCARQGQIPQWPNAGSSGAAAPFWRGSRAMNRQGCHADHKLDTAWMIGIGAGATQGSSSVASCKMSRMKSREFLVGWQRRRRLLCLQAVTVWCQAASGAESLVVCWSGISGVESAYAFKL